MKREQMEKMKKKKKRERIQKTLHWKRQSHGAPTQLHKNGPWVWNTSLPRVKEPTQTVPGLLPCVGICFLVSISMSTLLSLLKACASYGT